MLIFYIYKNIVVFTRIIVYHILLFQYFKIYLVIKHLLYVYLIYLGKLIKIKISNLNQKKCII